MHNCEVHELPAVVPQPQPVLEMCHVYGHGGDHAARGDEEEEKSDYAHLGHLQLWLELSSLLQLTAVAILLPFLYN